MQDFLSFAAKIQGSLCSRENVGSLLLKFDFEPNVYSKNVTGSNLNSVVRKYELWA